MEQIVYHCLEGSGGVYKPKIYYGWLINSNVYCECCFLLVLFFDSSIVISLPQVQLHKNPFIAYPIQDIGDQ